MKIDNSNFDYNKIVSQITERIRKDPNIHYQGENTLFTTITDIFAAATDMIMYNIERRAEETFLDTARLDSTGILIANMLGYVPSRNTPAKSRIKITIPWDDDNPIFNNIIKRDTEIMLGDKRDWRFDDNYFKFSYDGLDFICDLTQIFTQDELKIKYEGEDIILYVDIIQGKYKSEILVNPDNNDKTKIFQSYTIENTKFSNYYAENDWNYNEFNSGDEYERLPKSYTKLWISNTNNGELFNPAKFPDGGTGVEGIDGFYVLNSRFLVDNSDDKIREYLQIESTSNLINKRNDQKRYCFIKNNIDKTISLRFGDNLFIRNGISNSKQINVIYIETEGAVANRAGIIGKDIDIKGKLGLKNNGIIREYSFEELGAIIQFESDITNGTNFESLDSIKTYAPATFASHDRLVTIQDYITFLMKYGLFQTPAKAAIAWGEQDEIIQSGNVFAIKNFANTVLYSTIGKIYSIDNEDNINKVLLNLDPENLDPNLNPETLWPDRYYDQALGGMCWFLLNNSKPIVAGDPLADNHIEYLEITIKRYLDKLNNDYLGTGMHNSIRLNNIITNRGIIGLLHVPLYPLIQYFEIAGKVKVNSYANLSDIELKINNAIYNFLDKNVNFNTPILKSDILNIIYDFPEVEEVDFNFVPLHFYMEDFNPDEALSITLDSLNGEFFADELLRIESYITEQVKAFTNPATAISNGTMAYDETVVNFGDNTIYDKFTAVNTSVTERNFWYNLVPNICKRIGPIGTAPNQAWSNLEETLMQINRKLKRYIQASMIDINGNITNFSLKHEIAALICDRNITNTNLRPEQYKLVYEFKI